MTDGGDLVFSNKWGQTQFVFGLKSLRILKISSWYFGAIHFDDGLFQCIDVIIDLFLIEGCVLAMLRMIH